MVLGNPCEKVTQLIPKGAMSHRLRTTALTYYKATCSLTSSEMFPKSFLIRAQSYFKTTAVVFVFCGGGMYLDIRIYLRDCIDG